MSKEWKPRVGEKAMILVDVVANDGDPEGMAPWLVQTISGFTRYVNAADLQPLPAQRHPWDALREAAALLNDSGDGLGFRKAEMLADRLECKANPPPAPDPVVVLRRLEALYDPHANCKSWQDARRAIAAADAAKERGE